MILLGLVPGAYEAYLLGVGSQNCVQRTEFCFQQIGRISLEVMFDLRR